MSNKYEVRYLANGEWIGKWAFYENDGLVETFDTEEQAKECMQDAIDDEN